MALSGAGSAALSLAHSFRYMRTKPPIIACKPPSEERRRSNESILSIGKLNWLDFFVLLYNYNIFLCMLHVARLLE